MTAITVANTDWEIIEDLDDALTAATIDDVAVFSSVTVTGSLDQAKEAQFAGEFPKVIVRYAGTSEGESPENVRYCAVALELMVTTKSSGGADEAARVQEILRLVNAAKNAVEANPPANACYWGDSNYWHNKLQWGRPKLDTTDNQPWITAVIPLEISYTLNSATSH